MTEAEKAAIRAREIAAPMGPWSVGIGQSVLDRQDDKLCVIVYKSMYPQAPDRQPQFGVAEFIAHAREDVPTLLAALEAAEQRVATLADAAAIFQHDGLVYRANLAAAAQQRDQARYAWKCYRAEDSDPGHIPVPPLAPEHDDGWLP